jgi:MFS family permease
MGAVFAAYFNGKLMDFNYRRWAKKLNVSLDKKRNMDLRNFPIEMVRMQPVFLLSPIGVAAYISMGWVLQHKVGLAAPLILEFICAFCLMAVQNTLSSLIVDLFPDRPAAATAAANLLRCWLGAAASAVINPMLNGMGYGWCFTLLGLLSMIGLLGLGIDVRYGMGWREERRVRIDKEKEREERKAQN